MDLIEGDEPVLLVSNHPNTAIDAILMKTEIDKDLVLTAASSLTKVPFAKRIFKQANIQLFYRRMDGLSNQVLRKNKGAIQTCSEILQEGNKLLIFPEGRSSPTDDLLDFKTGFARIAKQYVEDTGKDLKVVTVYLNYSDKDKLRSAVSIKFLQPISPKQKIEEYDESFVDNYVNDFREVLERTMKNDKQFKADELQSKGFLDKVLAIPFVLFHIVPSTIIIGLTELISDRKDAHASIRIFLSVIFFPLFWFIELILLLALLPGTLVIFLIVYSLIWIYHQVTNYVVSFQDNFSQSS